MDSMGHGDGQGDAVREEETPSDRPARTGVLRLCMILLILSGAVIVPFIFFGDVLETRTVSWLDAMAARPAALAIAVVMFLGLDVLLPVPSSLVAVLSGSVLGLVGGTFANWIGLSLGSLLGYWIGRRGGRIALGRSDRAWELAELIADRFGGATIAICRPIPVLAEVSAIYLGISGMRLSRYLLISSASNLAVATAYAATGAWAASFDSFLMLFVASVSLPAVLWMVWRILSTRIQQPDPSKP